MGAAFNEINLRITIHRKRLLTGRNTLKMVEAVLSIWLVLTIYYLIPFAMPCRTIGGSAAGSPDATLFHGTGDESACAIAMLCLYCQSIILQKESSSSPRLLVAAFLREESGACSLVRRHCPAVA